MIGDSHWLSGIPKFLVSIFTFDGSIVMCTDSVWISPLLYQIRIGQINYATNAMLEMSFLKIIHIQ